MKSVAGAIAAIFATTSIVFAQPYQPAPPPQPVGAPAEVVVRQATGWYLRGDVGYAFTDLRGASYFQGSNDNFVNFQKASLDDNFTLGGGVGYQINNYLRTDVTLDYLFSSKYNGSTSGLCGSCGPGGSSVAAFSRDTASLTAVSLLANAYVDLGTFGAFTPYVGAGIGGTHVKWKDLHDTNCSVADPTSCDPEDVHRGRGSWRFTYALMAGTSIDLTCNLKADVGYRFRHIDGGDMFEYALAGGPGYDKGINIHEARLGARYVFGGCQSAAYIPPADIPVYK